MSELILFVDDDETTLHSIKAMLGMRFDAHTALGPEEGLRVLQGPARFAVVVCDMRMPGMDGIAFLHRAREVCPDTIRIMHTGHGDLDVAINAVNEGQIFRFLTKPSEPDVMTRALEAALEQYRLVMAERDLLQGTLRGSVQMLTNALSMANPVAFGRSQRLARYARKIAAAAMIPITWDLELSFMLSHIGCIALPRPILEKIASGQALTTHEQQLYSQHPRFGMTLLEHIPRLESVAQIVGRQNGRYGFDGPESINLGASLLRLASDIDTMVSQDLGPQDILNRIRSAGDAYAPSLLAALEAMLVQDAKRVLRRVPIDALREGMVLEEGLVSEQGMLLLAKGHELTSAGIQRIHMSKSSFRLNEQVLVSVPAS